MLSENQCIGKDDRFRQYSIWYWSHDLVLRSWQKGRAEPPLLPDFRAERDFQLCRTGKFYSDRCLVLQLPVQMHGKDFRKAFGIQSHQKPFLLFRNPEYPDRTVPDETQSVNRR